MKHPNNCIAKRLKEARLACGISQEKLGILAGIHEHSASARMNQYERGTHLPNLLTLQHIGKVLGYPAAFFISDDDVIAKLVYLASQLSEADKLKILKTVQELASHYGETLNAAASFDKKKHTSTEVTDV